MMPSREDMLKEMQIMELMKEILESQSDVKTEAWSKGLTTEMDNPEWFKEEVVFQGIAKDEKIGLEKILELEVCKNNIEIIFNEISFKSSTHNEQRFDMIIKGLGEYIHPLKIMFGGSFVEEYIAFTYQEDDYILTPEQVESYNDSWGNDNVIPKDIKDNIRKFIALAGENPLQMPLNPKEVVGYTKRFNNFQSNALALFRIECFRLFSHDREFKYLFREVLSGHNRFGLGMVYNLIREVSFFLMMENQMKKDSELFTKLKGPRGPKETIRKANKKLSIESSVKFFVTDKIDKILSIFWESMEEAEKLQISENKIDEAKTIMSYLVDKLFIDEDEEEIGESDGKGFHLGDNAEEVFEKFGITSEQLDSISKDEMEKGDIKVKSVRLEDLLKLIDQAQKEKKD